MTIIHRFLTIIYCLLIYTGSSAQEIEPDYHKKNLLTEEQPEICKKKRISNDKKKILRICDVHEITIYDVAEDGVTPVKFNQECFYAIEGPPSDKWNGVFHTYIFSKGDPVKKYLVWTQEYVDGVLRGKFDVYYLNGKLALSQTVDSGLIEKEIEYYPDGKTKMSERIFKRDRSFHNIIYSKGDLRTIADYNKDGKLDGVAIKYYANGNQEEFWEWKEGKANGAYRYYYESGQVWIEMEYKDDKAWNVIANYSIQGEERDAGTLRNGNGTVIYYNLDGTVREIANFIGGERKSY